MTANFRLLVRNLRLMEADKRLAQIGEQAIVHISARAAMNAARRTHRKLLRTFYDDMGGSFDGDPHDGEDEALLAAYNSRKETVAVARREQSRLRALIKAHQKS